MLQRFMLPSEKFKLALRCSAAHVQMLHSAFETFWRTLWSPIVLNRMIQMSTTLHTMLQQFMPASEKILLRARCSAAAHVQMLNRGHPVVCPFWELQHCTWQNYTLEKYVF